MNLQKLFPMSRRATWAWLVIASCCGAAVQAEDWPQWLGPQRDSQWREEGIVNRIPAEGLKVLWRVPVKYGYAGPAVANGRVYVPDLIVEEGELQNSPSGRSELRGRERLLCLDAATGKVLWQDEEPVVYRLSYPSGPRATPTVADGKVYMLGAEGHLRCLDAATGKRLWTRDFQKDYGAETPIWGFCSAPLVDGQKLICVVGGKGSLVVAFDKDTGREIWKALTAPEPGYAPPTMIEAAGRKQLLIWPPDQLYSLNPETGEVYWQHPLKPDYGMTIMAPRQAGDYLFASGIGNVGALFKLSQDKPDASVVWRGKVDNAVYCANSTPIIEDETIFGVDCRTGALMAVDLKTGDRLWQTFQPTTGDRRAGHGTAFLVQNGDRYFLFNEQGDLIMARITRQGYDEIGRFHVLKPTNEAFNRPVVWSHPAFAQRCVFARNDEEIVCVSLAKE